MTNLLTKEDVEQWNNFIEELNELKLAYNITIDNGCSCCFEGHTINDKKVEIPYFKDEPDVCAYKIIRLGKIDPDEVS